MFNSWLYVFNILVPKLKYLLFFSVLLIGFGLCSSPVSAHAFGQRYDLPLPLSFFMTGGGLAVLVSFIIMAIIANPEQNSIIHGNFDLLKNSIGRAVCHPIIIQSLRLIFVAIFLLILATGFIFCNFKITSIHFL